MKRTILAAALVSGALAVPAYALASGAGTDPASQQGPATAPVQQQEQDPQQPRGHDCPEGQGNGAGPEGQGNGTAPEAPDSGSGGGSSDTLL